MKKKIYLYATRITSEDYFSIDKYYVEVDDSLNSSKVFDEVREQQMKLYYYSIWHLKEIDEKIIFDKTISSWNSIVEVELFKLVSQDLSYKLTDFVLKQVKWKWYNENNSKIFSNDDSVIEYVRSEIKRREKTRKLISNDSDDWLELDWIQDFEESNSFRNWTYLFLKDDKTTNNFVSYFTEESSEWLNSFKKEIWISSNTNELEIWFEKWDKIYCEFDELWEFEIECSKSSDIWIFIKCYLSDFNELLENWYLKFISENNESNLFTSKWNHIKYLKTSKVDFSSLEKQKMILESMKKHDINNMN